jgi:CDP-diacylglycerol--glycerol-3-phosphate 3-phosphatidyltransferase
MLYLLEVELIPSWAVLIVLAREFVVSGLRMVVASEGTVVAASNLGKWKTAITMIAISGFLLAITLPSGEFAQLIMSVSQASMVAAVVLTAWSGTDYLLKCWPSIVRSR